jgi:GLPGLI family protein
MKKAILSLSLAAMAVCAAFTTATAQIKEGSITYSMTIDGLPPEQAAMMQGMEMKTYFKNGKSRSEMNSAFVNTITVTDGKGGAITLMDQMGQKIYFKSKPEEGKKKDKKEDPKITYSDEKKTVAGYECKKAVVEAKDDKGNVSTVTVWYTDKIAPVETGGRGQQFKGLKGVPLEFEMPNQGMVIKFAATNVSSAAVPDSKFEVSTEGYTEMDPNQMGGGQGQ